MKLLGQLLIGIISVFGFWIGAYLFVFETPFFTGSTNKSELLNSLVSAFAFGALVVSLILQRQEIGAA